MGNQVGIIQTRDALEMARERGLDLVEVAPNAVPPVCRLMDYGKFRYEQSRKEREARKNQHVIELKEVRIRPKIDDHDLETKGRPRREIPGRWGQGQIDRVASGAGENAHPEIGRACSDQLAEMLRTHGNIEQSPRLEGKTMTMLLGPLKQKPGAQEREGGRSP